MNKRWLFVGTSVTLAAVLAALKWPVLWPVAVLAALAGCAFLAASMWKSRDF